MNKPSYIDRGGELVFKPPYASANIHHFSFMVGADITALQAVCDKYFNTPLKQPGRYKAGGPFVLFVGCEMPLLHSLTPPYSQMGMFKESEVAIWIMMIDTVEEEIRWFVPYIFVDNPYAMVMGREVYGFHKSFGTSYIPPSFDNPDHFTLDTLAFKTFSPTSQAEIVRMIEINKLATPASHSIAGDWDDITGLAKELVKFMETAGSIVGDIRLILHAVEDLINMKIPMVFLKEFRDCTDTSLAAYQSIVETKATMRNFHIGKIYSNNFEVVINDCDSHPIRTELGLAQGNLKVDVAFGLHFDFEISAATETIIG